MLQTNMQPYASDALEDAMRLAQTKALNSYSFSDCLNYLNYAWMDMYHRLIQIDSGYFSTTVRLTQKLTTLPPFVKSSIKIYASLDPVGYNRQIFRESGMGDLNSTGTYHISGFDLYCPDAEKRAVWLEYVPIQAQIFFTHHNRDPKIYDKFDAVINNDYGLYTLENMVMKHKNTSLNQQINIEPFIKREDSDIVFMSCDFPYLFITYKHKVTGKHLSGFYIDILNKIDFVEYNPFAFTGRHSNVQYLKCKYNDKTGMGVVIKDHEDGKIKELGWTPDTLLVYPCPEMYRLLVARLADKFSALNESNVMGVAKELTEATYAFNAFCDKNKSAWGRITNVNLPNLTDYIV